MKKIEFNYRNKVIGCELIGREIASIYIGHNGQALLPESTEYNSHKALIQNHLSKL